MNIFHALILGIVEGITEFLPISSTAHLLIVNRLLGLSGNFVKSFDIFIQLGSIMAVVILYIRRLFMNWRTFWSVVLAFIPTALIGLLVYPYVKSVLLGNLLIAAIALIIGGIILILFEKYHQTFKDVEKISYGQAIAIGFFQALAIIPGVSRSAATIIGGQSIGITRKAIVEFSFLLAIPTMTAATGLDLLKNHFSFSGNEWTLLIVGFIASFVTALLAIKSFLKYIQNHSFANFGWYRIGLGLIIIVWLFV